MKFTKEQAIEKIKAEYTAKGEKTDLDRTIKEHVESLCAILGDESEIELDVFVKKATPFVETALGLSRKTGSEAVKNYKETHKEEPKTETNKKDDDKDESELEKRLAVLEQRLKESETKEKIQTVKSSLLAKLREKGISDDDWSKDFVSEMDIKEDLDVEAKADAILKLYNKSKSKNSPSKTPSSTSHGEDKENSLSDVAEYMKKQNEMRAQIQ